MAEAVKKQVGGTHYNKDAIQPIEFAFSNSLDFFQGSIVKYITRWRSKNGVEDLEKAKHFLEMYIELENKRVIEENHIEPVYIWPTYNLDSLGDNISITNVRTAIDS